MKYIIFVLVLLLTACGMPSVSTKHINKAYQLCQSNGGLDIIVGVYDHNDKVTHTIKVYCKNNAYFSHEWRE